MPDESTFRDRKATVPVTCQQCGKVYWYEVEDWPPPVLCPMCDDLAVAAEMAFAQAMEELFDA